MKCSSLTYIIVWWYYVRVTCSAAHLPTLLFDGIMSGLHVVQLTYLHRGFVLGLHVVHLTYLHHGLVLGLHVVLDGI